MAQDPLQADLHGVQRAVAYSRATGRSKCVATGRSRISNLLKIWSENIQCDCVTTSKK